MNASDVMSRNILSVGRDTTITEAIRLMLDNQISGLPVIDAGRLVGILTEGDLLRRSATGTERHRPRWLEILMGPGRLAGEYVRTHGRKVEEIMTRNLVSVTPVYDFYSADVRVALALVACGLDTMQYAVAGCVRHGDLHKHELRG